MLEPRGCDGRRRARIVLATDYADWAFSRVAAAVVEYVRDFEFAIVPLADLSNDLNLRLMARDADLIHYFFRGFARNALSADYADHKFGALSGAFRSLLVGAAASTITSSVHDDVGHDESSLADYRDMFQAIRGYYVSSSKLKLRYDALDGIRKPWGTIEEGFDATLFRPRADRRRRTVADDPLVVGWVGNADWGNPGQDHKGFHTVVLPAIERLQKRGVPVRAHFAERTRNPVPYRAMPDYYAEIDVMVCASKGEGAPQPVLQAMACGCAVVSTDVGIVSDAFGPLQAQFILHERSVDALSDALARLVAEPATLAALAAENLDRVPAWDWSRKALRYATFFSEMLTDACSATPA